MSDPKRFVGDQRAAPIGRSLLEGAAASGPTDAELNAVWASIAARLSPPAGTGGRATSPPEGGRVVAANTTLSAKMAGVVVGLGAAATLTVAATHFWSAHGTSGRALASVQGTATEGPPPAAVEVATRSIAPGAASPAVANSGIPAPASVSPVRVAPPHRDPGQKAGSGVPGNQLAAESALVLRARQTLRDGDCEGAADLLDAGRRRFVAGALAEEREALAIQALACAGRRDEATGRGEAFLHEHPESLHADAVRRLVR